MTGSSNITINAGTSYTDQGATATDNINGTISVTTSGSVNTNTVGTYTITYNATDSSGNAATPVTRTVTVVDATAPTVAFGTNGNATYAKTRSTTVTISDAHTGVNASSLKYMWNTSTTTPTEASFTTTFTNGGTLTTPAGVTGSYYLWILAKDNAGNTTITRTNVFNLDNTKPVITLNGSSTVNIAINSTYTDAGAIANDTPEGVITSKIVVTSTVNPSVGGSYTVTYNVSDTAGNAAVSVTRTVIVKYCADGTLTNDPTYGYVCYKAASSSSSCNSCTYSVSNYGSNCSSCGSTCSKTDTASNIATTTYSCPSGYTASGSGSSTTCTKTVAASSTAATKYCENASYSVSGGSCVRTVSCSGCSGQGVDCMNTKCGIGGYENPNWSCGTSTCTATMSLHYSCSSGTLNGTNCYSCSSGTLSGTNCVSTASNIATTSYSCPSGYTSSGSGSSMTCSKTTTTTSSSTCPSDYTTVSCNSCTYYTSTYGANCSSCGSTTSYYCPSGWSNYTGSGSSLTCYKGAN
jgi:hypothetical protein